MGSNDIKITMPPSSSDLDRSETSSIAYLDYSVSPTNWRWSKPTEMEEIEEMAELGCGLEGNLHLRARRIPGLWDAVTFTIYYCHAKEPGCERCENNWAPEQARDTVKRRNVFFLAP